MTIEHLAPQSSASDRVGPLGNLIYVTESLNGDLDNKSWEEKRSILRNVADEWVPDDVKAATSWGTPEITARTQQLAELGRTKVWTG